MICEDLKTSGVPFHEQLWLPSAASMPTVCSEILGPLSVLDLASAPVAETKIDTLSIAFRMGLFWPSAPGFQGPGSAPARSQRLDLGGVWRGPADPPMGRS